MSDGGDALPALQIMIFLLFFGVLCFNAFLSPTASLFSMSCESRLYTRTDDILTLWFQICLITKISVHLTTASSSLTASVDFATSYVVPSF